MPLSHILRKCIAGNKLSKVQEKINHLFARNKKELEILIKIVRTQSEHRDGIW